MDALRYRPYTVRGTSLAGIAKASTPLPQARSCRSPHLGLISPLEVATRSANRGLGAPVGLARFRYPFGLAAWKECLTGYPVVDAGMRELAATGFMPNRTRMIVASFLTTDLNVDWRGAQRILRASSSMGMSPRTRATGSGRPERAWTAGANLQPPHSRRSATTEAATTSDVGSQNSGEYPVPPSTSPGGWPAAAGAARYGARG